MSEDGEGGGPKEEALEEDLWRSMRGDRESKISREEGEIKRGKKDKLEEEGAGATDLERAEERDTAGSGVLMVSVRKKQIRMS